MLPFADTYHNLFSEQWRSMRYTKCYYFWYGKLFLMLSGLLLSNTISLNCRILELEEIVENI